MTRFGRLVGGAGNPAPAPAAPSEPAPAVSPSIPAEAIAPNKEEDVELIPYESDLSLHDMTKKELEEYGRTVGIELDRRHSKESLVQELEDYLASDS